MGSISTFYLVAFLQYYIFPLSESIKILHVSVQSNFVAWNAGRTQMSVFGIGSFGFISKVPACNSLRLKFGI